ncbi:MAG: Na+/H+ antiporter NhaC family protein [Paraglaciecola sp.]|uniref:Na+/H+ antiporter NhaC family protein n=1 Tax=Paraglaciecola sp. TaxID=1920173 RepID=UPI003298420C
MFEFTKRISFIFFIISLLSALYVNFQVSPTWVESQLSYQTYNNELGQLAYRANGQEVLITNQVPYENSPLRQSALDKQNTKPPVSQQWVYRGTIDNVVLLKADFHFGMWSLLPAFVAVALCLMTREPLVALFGGIVTGAVMLGRFDITHEVFIPNIGTASAASILILYLWLLGGLMGIWAKTGAAKAFADHMSQHYVKGPRSAKVVTWFLGLVFFQGGTMSTVLVGTTVKPIADKAGVSHEELSYVVDSTASPIASIIAFNAWPAYIQVFLFIPGVAFLATESDRIAFFFASVPFSFYAIFAVVGTLLLSLNITTFSGPLLKKANKRARETGALDGPTASPISAKELHESQVPEGYSAHRLEFVLPLVSLIVIAIGSFFTTGTPQIHWAFSGALFLSIFIALAKGMSLKHVLDGFGNGLKGVVVASVILMFALTIGVLSKQLGGGIYLVESLGEHIPFWCLPIILQLMTMVIAFSTGTSWGTYAIAFPLGLPLAWTIAQTQGLDNPELFMMVCFATILNGSVYGDQCSPISDTTILSSMTTGCDLMDHVKSQIVPATYAAILAALLWTMTVGIFT